MSPFSYVMPPEWARHEATWLSWPHKEASWPGKFEPVPGVFAEIASVLCRYEEVHINVLDEKMERSARQLLKEHDDSSGCHDRIVFHRVPTDDAWCRDHGPDFVFRRTGETVDKVIVNWGFNAWGGKYEPFDHDDAVASAVAAVRGYDLVDPAMILEGGAIDVNGSGLLLTTEACLLNPNRNPSMGRGEIEEKLRTYLGIHKVLWLRDGIVGDDTDGHVDDIARFVNEDTVVIAVEDDPSDDNYDILQENYQLLRGFTGLDGRPLNIVPLPMPEPVYYENERLPASYANFYIANRQVLVPLYGSLRDELAIETLADCFPDRQVIGIDCRDLIWGLGAIHCITHEEPALP
ncbi:agmatine deiminase family protein [Prosthecochloris sp. N3]|uniref:Agmatine deiminase family protein n=1 Tax=Prosthecochloris ethylica TaxID=2743976 RepID=A0ABR9XSW4_9CHLB|nr:agmatine deiminase family protein [Prosthecochloris ethylica]MBF0585609.1 agmatine deiminase family protein [Prosthecochloris ethylica]MBF0637098.1 agmatine deiminase family protein [Prosthecochloris ethylica]NUK46839.1 agmatine deiminase family protein [Prosthecochloris ethylica]